jgi:hypothetical protein
LRASLVLGYALPAPVLRPLLRVAHAAGLAVVREDRVTPFVRFFLIGKVAAAPTSANSAPPVERARFPT